jgi:hypothetical protein
VLSPSFLLSAALGINPHRNVAELDLLVMTYAMARCRNSRLLSLEKDSCFADIPSCLRWEHQ